MVGTLYPPGPRNRFFGGQGSAFRRDPLNFLTNLAREHGDVAHFRVESQRVFLLNHPDYIKDVLVTQQANFLKARAQLTRQLLGEGLLTSEGEFHRRQRRLSQPAFHRRRMSGYGTVMVERAAQLRERWQDGQTLDIASEMMRLTLSIVSKTLFNADVEAETDEVGTALSEIRKLFETPNLPHSKLLEKMPFVPAARRFQKARDQLDAIIYRIIEERRRSDTDQGDLISMLLLARDEGEGGEQMTDEQVRDEAMTLFLAGHDTTSNALSWTWYLLSQHPEVEAKLHHEIDTVLAGKLPSTEDIARLKYTEMVFTEAIRLYPPAWRIGRRVIDDYEVGGYRIPSGSLVLLSQYVMHRDPRYFPDPSQFDPERWTDVNLDSRPQFSYFPFGAGARRCIGEGFARTAGVLLLATLAGMWRMKLVSNHKVEMQPLLTLRPKHGIRMTLERRR
ncbi:MAG: cytochrome P450 [Pyrinomonadaceae bacterium]|nr:cytochrome P450 [Pyrinomonadaceae bacterium]